MDDKPWNERAKLFGREQIDFEHCHRMWADWFVPNSIDPEFGKLAPDAFPQFLGKLGLGSVRLKVIDVDIEAAACGVGDRVGELFVRRAGVGGGRVNVRLRVRTFRMLLARPSVRYGVFCSYSVYASLLW